MSEKTSKSKTLRIFIRIVAGIIFTFLLLIISGDWHWIEGWVICLWFLAQILITTLYLYFKNPGLLKERLGLNAPLNQKKWDKYFLYLYSVFLILWFVIIPLDAKRFHWSGVFPVYIKLLGILLLLSGSVLILKALGDNPFASTVVRLQEDRKQYVVSTGVYSVVRHPIYLGGIIAVFGIPMFLSSVWGCVGGILIAIMLIIRILGEEKMLETELEGYKEYEQKVKYRLIPFVW